MIKSLYKKFSSYIKAFSLVELMIILVTISCIIAAFAPVVSKKMSYNTVSVGGGVAGKVCESGYYLSNESCQECGYGYYSLVGSLACKPCQKGYCCARNSTKPTDSPCSSDDGSHVMIKTDVLSDSNR